jgi:(p)ppGpp synthase/HD superfamily hydrolase
VDNTDTLTTPRFLKALSYAVQLHAADLRKGTSVPYIAHLLGVCALVLTDGGTEDEAVAALLHDALEDHPEETSRERLRADFGDEVLAIVAGCTDTPVSYTGGEKPPWRQRKTAYLEHIRAAGSQDLRVSMADKLDNVRSMLSDYRQVGDDLWSRFNAGKEDQLWLLRSVVQAFRAAGAAGPLVDEFERTAAELDRIAG